jgi:hypothetical protein
MKKMIILFCLSFFGVAAFPQMALENVYNVSASLTHLEDNGYKYYIMDVPNNQCRLYNLDHSVWKIIPLDVPSGRYLYNIQYVSDKLFNNDSKVELSYTYYLYNDTAQYFFYETRVVNESGDVLVTIPGASYVEVKLAGAETYKYLAYVWDYSVIPYTVETWVYSIPGRLLSAGPWAGDTRPRLEPYPNPATTEIKIPYNLPEGSTQGILTVYDMNGKIVKTYNVDRTFDFVNVDVGEFPKGTYIMRLTTGGDLIRTGKFMVR